jgi:hypothetical protein
MGLSHRLRISEKLMSKSRIKSGRIIIRAESEERSLEPAGPLLEALGKLPFTQCPSDTPLFSIKTYTPLWLREGSALL